MIQSTAQPPRSPTGSKAIIGNEQPLDVKRIDQVITLAPYDYVLIGSYSKWEKPSPRIYKFIETHKDALANKQVCYFLTCGRLGRDNGLKGAWQRSPFRLPAEIISMNS